MLINIVYYGSLKNLNKPTEVDFIGTENTLEALCSFLEIPLKVDIWILLNGERVPLETLLNAGDTVSFFQPVGGG